jgi:oligopeptide transport system substrate-binding protein
VRAVYNDTVAPMDGVVISGVAGATEDACGGRCAYDPTESKALIKEAFGKKKPPAIAIDYDASTTQEAIAKTMAASLKEVGVTAKLRGKPFADYQEFVGTGKQQMFRLGWISVYPSADAFLLPLFLSGVPDNVTGFANDKIDKLLRSARAEADADKRAALYAKAEATIMKYVPVVPIAQFQTHSVSATRVHDLDVTVGGTFDPTRVWVTGG